MTTKRLLVLMNGRSCGVVEQDGNQLAFNYDAAWVRDPTAFPLSLSMPLEVERHNNDVISAFMWGLLPDNEITLDAWAKMHHVSAGNCFGLLGAVGEDCPGAIQFIPPERIDELEGIGRIDWLSEEALVSLIRDLVANPGRGRRERTGGQFSLAGAQTKTALYREDGKWGVPGGGVPTTHILKPFTDLHDGQIENEHFCLRLAQRLGMRAADTEVLDIGGIPVICSTRYDRVRNNQNKIVRLHQEDTCQALEVHPRKKYENEGGPNAVRIMQLLKDHSTAAGQDRDRFVRALAYNFVIGNTDGHAKNYALLLLRKQVRLAPLYDIASYLPYMGKEKGVKLAMKIGGKYEMDEIMPHHWERFAEEAGFDKARALAQVRDIIFRLPGEALSLLSQCRAEGLKSDHLSRLVDDLWQRDKLLAAIYGAEQTANN